MSSAALVALLAAGASASPAVRRDSALMQVRGAVQRGAPSAETTLRPQFQRVGCFPRAAGDEHDPHVYFDKTCVHAPRSDPARPCRSGLPFFRKTMEEGQSFLDCAGFCLSKGLDLSGVAFSSAAGGAPLECRCGAERDNAPAWHERVAPEGLLLPRSSAVAEGDPACAILVTRYVGALDDGAVPYRLLQLSVDDAAYLDEVSEGKEVVVEEDDAADDVQEVDVDVSPASGADLSLLGARGLCQDGPTSGLVSGGRQLGCSEARGWCGQFASVQSRCPLSCERCSSRGAWLSCYPNSCSPGGGPWLTKNASGFVNINYFFTAGLDSDRQEAFKLATQEWEAKTCICFVESSQTPRIQVGVTNENSCSATLGFPGESGTNNVNLGWCNSRRQVGSIIHEIGHSMGMNHEQKRGDAQAAINTPVGQKGPYLRMFWNNIEESWRSQFLPDGSSYIGSTSAGYADYDYGSIMHYGRSSAVSEQGENAFETINPVFNSVVGSRSALSENDVRQIQDMYQCSARCNPNPAPAPPAPDPEPAPAPTQAPNGASGSCQRTCSQQNCDFWVQEGYSCQTLTSQFGCSCGGCSRCGSAPSPTPAPTRAPTAAPTAAPGSCPNTCSQGYSCDFWAGQGYSCQVLSDQYSCSCGGCPRCSPGVTPAPSPAPSSCTRTCQGETCDFWVQQGYSCQDLTNKHGCSCGGCSRCSTRDAGVIED